MDAVLAYPHLARGGLAAASARANLDSLAASPALPAVVGVPCKAFRRRVPRLGEFAHPVHVREVERAPAAVNGDVEGGVLAGRESLKVAGAIVERVLVLVVDVPSVRDRADLGLVDLDVKRPDPALAPCLARPEVDAVLAARAVRVAGEDDSAVGDPIGSHVHILSS